MKWGVFFAVLVVAGCQGKPLDQLSYSELKLVAAEIGARCEAQGITRSSPEWGLCVRQETDKEDATRSRAADRRNSAIVCNRVGYTTICN